MTCTLPNGFWDVEKGNIHKSNKSEQKQVQEEEMKKIPIKPHRYLRKEWNKEPLRMLLMINIYDIHVCVCVCNNL